MNRVCVKSESDLSFPDPNLDPSGCPDPEVDPGDFGRPGAPVQGKSFGLLANFCLINLRNYLY